MRKILIILLSICSLPACDSHLVDLNNTTSQINRHIDHSQKNKTAYFLEKAEADYYNNALILFHSSNLPINNKEFIIFKAIQINGYCKNTEIHKELFSKGVKFILILKNNNGVEFDRLQISVETCAKIYSNTNKSQTSKQALEKDNQASVSNLEIESARALKEAKAKLDPYASSQNNLSKSELEFVLSKNQLDQRAKPMDYM